MEGSQNGRAPIERDPATGRYPLVGQQAIAGLDLVRETGCSEQEAAEQIGVAAGAIQRLRGILARRPDLEQLIRDGEMTVYQAMKLAGYRNKEFRGEAKLDWQPGRGDKWDEVCRIALIYLRAQREKGMSFAHVPPKDAKQRLEEINEIVGLLEQMRSDLEPRSHRATLKVN